MNDLWLRNLGGIYRDMITKLTYLSCWLLRTLIIKYKMNTSFCRVGLSLPSLSALGCCIKTREQAVTQENPKILAGLLADCYVAAFPCLYFKKISKIYYSDLGNVHKMKRFIFRTSSKTGIRLQAQQLYHQPECGSLYQIKWVCLRNFPL